RKNNRFFDYRAAEIELAKLLFLKPEPDIGLISSIKLEQGKPAPKEIVKSFVHKLRQEMGKIRECEIVLVEREKFLAIKNIEAHTAALPEFLPGMAENLAKITKKIVGEEKLIHSEIQPDPTSIDWQELEKMFREEYRLDRLDYGHLGTSHRDQLEHKLELQKVYVALNVKDRSFDRIMQAAKVKVLILQQQKNLPLLFQQFDELLHLEHEKDERTFYVEMLSYEEQSYKIARKILEKCKSPNLQNAGLIIAEIMSS
ncbi:MAG: hypothetical protein JSW07_07375, partial [bacterium]